MIADIGMMCEGMTDVSNRSERSPDCESAQDQRNRGGREGGSRYYRNRAPRVHTD